MHVFKEQVGVKGNRAKRCLKDVGDGTQNKSNS